MISIILQDDVHTYIVTEYLRGGELLDRIRRKKRFSENEAANYVKKLVSVIEFLHSLGIVHRDLKPEVSSTYLTNTRREDS